MAPGLSCCWTGKVFGDVLRSAKENFARCTRRRGRSRTVETSHGTMSIDRIPMADYGRSGVIRTVAQVRASDVVSTGTAF